MSPIFSELIPLLNLTVYLSNTNINTRLSRHYLVSILFLFHKEIKLVYEISYPGICDCMSSLFQFLSHFIAFNESWGEVYRNVVSLNFLLSVKTRWRTCEWVRH
jgi:hypothetical protein